LDLGNGSYQVTRTYQCESCKGTFEESWSDQEARQEFDQKFSGCDPADVVKVCDDCYQRFMKWYKVQMQ